MLLAASVITILVLNGGPDGPAVAQVCPVGPTLAWTAAHVMEKVQAPYWRAGAYSGRLELLTLDSKRDLARVRSEGQNFPFHHKVGPLPETGAPVTVFGFDVYAEGTYRLRGFFIGRDSDDEGIMDVPTHTGTSGSCVLDEAGRVVMINVGVARYTVTPAKGFSKMTLARGRPLPGAPKE